MDFRPNSSTLILNYAITFGLVGGLLWLSAGKPTRYYYSPEYNSHAGYGPGAQSCRQCHVSPWAKFEEKTCWTAGCHTRFDPAQGQPDPVTLALKQDEFGNPRPHFGAMIALHRLIGSSQTCGSCHPSHQVPQTGQFNRTTVHMAAAERFQRQPPRSPQEQRAVETEIFHARAEHFTGKLSCQTCHVEALEAERGTGGVDKVDGVNGMDFVD